MFDVNCLTAAIAIFSSVVILGCSESTKPDMIIKRERVNKLGEVVYINPPKHFSVHIKFDDGVTQELRSNKHCNGWRDHIKIGDTFNIPVEIQHYESGGIVTNYYIKSCNLIRGDYKVND